MAEMTEERLTQIEKFCHLPTVTLTGTGLRELIDEVRRLRRERDEARAAYDSLSAASRPTEDDVYEAWLEAGGV